MELLLLLASMAMEKLQAEKQRLQGGSGAQLPQRPQMMLASHCRTAPARPRSSSWRCKPLV